MSQQNLSYDTITVQMEIEERLPRFVLDEIFIAKESDDDWSTEKLKARLWALLKRKEQIQILHPKEPLSAKPKFNTQFSPHSKMAPPSQPDNLPTLTFHSKRNEQFNPKQMTEKLSPKPKLPCLFCDDPSHFSSFCPTFSDHKTRLDRLKALNRCFKCVKTGHHSRQCPAPARCSNCKGSHHRVLCFSQPGTSQRATNFSHSQPAQFAPQFSNPTPLFPPSSYPSLPPSNPNSSPTQLHPQSFSETYRPPSQSNFPNITPDHSATVDQTNTAITTPACLSSHPILLKCVKVTIFHPWNLKKSVECIALLDDASTHSYINLSEAKVLGLNLNPVSVNLGVFNDPKIKTVRTFSTQFGLRLMNGRSLLVTANAIGALTQPTSYLPFSPELFSDVRLDRKFYSTSPSILLGADFYYEVEPIPIKRLPSGYHLVQTLLGPLVAGGPTRKPLSPPVRLVNFSIQTPEQYLIPPDFFSLEGIGIKDDPQPPDTNDLVLEKFDKSIQFIDNRYQVNLPFRSDPKTLPLPSNFGLCFGRLRSVINTLSKNPSLLDKYDAIVREQKNAGIIEYVSNPQEISPPLHYLAHHPVITHKLRIVYDGSAKIGNELSLNDCLFPGPVILPDLVGLLLRFRIPPIAITCDIEKAFLQVSVNPEHRDCTRFLWLKDPKLPLSNSNLQIFRFTRVSFGLTSSPFLLAATIRHHLSLFPSELSKEVSLNTYVDNILLSVRNPTEGQTKSASIVSLFQKAGMSLREFASNSELALSRLPNDRKLDDPNQKFLGIKWNTQTNFLEFNLFAPSNFVPSKRSILSFIASQYDPLGLISPLILPLKIFLQSLFQNGFDWDQTLSHEIQKQWEKVISLWQQSEKVSIPRCPIPIAFHERHYQLHCFTDASSLAMCAAVFLRVIHPLSQLVETFLIFSKTKVKPVHKGTPLTIPRLELIAVEIGTRALKFTQSQLSTLDLDSKLTLWSDSSIVLSWLNSSQKTLEIFVQNRINSIQATPNLVVRHLPGSENPADLGTRGVDSAQFLSESPIWWSGPKWLTLPPAHWPTNPQIKPFHSNPTNPRTSTVNVPLFTLFSEQLSDQKMIDLSLFSRLPKVLRIIAISFRFIARIQKIPNQKPISVPITFPELKKAFKFLICQEQKCYPPSDQDTETLGLFTDKEKFIRAKGRLGKSQLPPSTISPIYLPPKSPLTHLIVYETHLLNVHSSPLMTLSLIRRNYWIPRGRQVIKSVIHKFCLQCRRFSVRPFDRPPFPSLPEDRVKISPPFSKVGLDYCGPVYISNSPSSSRKKSKKFWIVIWVCLPTRALSLDVVEDQSAPIFTLAFRRFVSKYSIPQTIYCDNAPTFIAFSKFLSHQFPTQWNFRVPHAPWRGGHYERLIALIKHHLRRTFTSFRPRTIPFNQLITSLTEIEMIVNARPITFDSSNPLDPQPLRPIDFIRPINPPQNFVSLLTTEFDPSQTQLPESTQKTLQTLWETASLQTERFWHQWLNDYLPSLRERYQKLNQSNNRWPKINEIVLIHHPTEPRSIWKTGIVIKINYNENNIPDTAEIKMPSGHHTTRSINQLYPLETAEELNYRIPHFNWALKPPRPTVAKIPSTSFPGKSWASHPPLPY